MRSLAVAVLLLLFALTASAQSGTGTIAGKITDPDGGMVANAPIQAKNAKTDSVYKATSSATGDYTISQLPAGTYDLSAAVPGFRRFEKKGVVVEGSKTSRIDLRIEDRPSLNTLGEDRALFASFDLPHAVPAGPTPRTPDGKPDLSGVWLSLRPIDPEKLPEPPAMLPWAAALVKERTENNGKDRPEARCLPGYGLKLLAGVTVKLVQSPALLVAISQYDFPGWHQVFLDGRGHPTEMNPAWRGHSVGKWEGDTLVVDTFGFNDKGWLDNNVPHTEMLRMTERLRRTDLGHLQVDITYDDPGTFTKPWKTTGIADLGQDVDIEEYICNENNQDVEHLIGK